MGRIQCIHVDTRGPGQGLQSGSDQPSRRAQASLGDRRRRRRGLRRPRGRGELILPRGMDRAKARAQARPRRALRRGRGDHRRSGPRRSVVDVVLDDRLLIEQLLVGLDWHGAQPATRRPTGTTGRAAQRWLAPAATSPDRSDALGASRAAARAIAPVSAAPRGDRAAATARRRSDHGVRRRPPSPAQRAQPRGGGDGALVAGDGVARARGSIGRCCRVSWMTEELDWETLTPS